MDENTLFEVERGASYLEVSRYSADLSIFLARREDCLSFLLDYDEAKALHEAIGEWLDG